ncbi:MAG: lipoate--protein ligase [Chloroflexi bacterium]|nr:lipoate--protein ligase [Chloroflexota bacterium]
MLFIDNTHTDPRLNLAMEEFILRNLRFPEPILFFYINEPAVIIGRNQNTLEEIDPDYVQANGIHVVRRLSGGGAVYHDLGNLNFSFVTAAGPDNFHNFARFTEPVIQVLRQLGVKAELREQSSIFANGKKISGNAQYATSGRMFSHGTLLFDTNIETMLHALNPRQVQIESKAVQSVRNFVTNIHEHLPQDMTIHELCQALLLGIFEVNDAAAIPTYTLSDENWTAIQQISAQRYANWEWNFGHSPRFNVQKSERLPIGKIDARISVENGKIQQIKFYGDFSGEQDLASLEAQLTGVRYEREALAAAIHTLNLTPYFGPLDPATFLSFIY